MMMTNLDAAGVRCARLAAGMREGELEQLAGAPAGSVAGWESGRAPIPENVANLLGDFTATAATETVRLIEQAAATGTITTFAGDDVVAAQTDGRIRLESVHRVCAGRAAMAVPQAQVVRRDVDGTERQAWLLCVTAAWGIGLGQMQRWFDVRRRGLQYWMFGERPAADRVLAEIAEIAEAARAHVDELAALIDPDDPVVWVCGTDEQMDSRWPARAQLPLATHQVCAARAAAGIDGARLVFLPR
ncbi:hypothetical protein [Gordonia sp. OPL2]|uniref:hypothetical protein n=1 Tax=Gordonia sp. OPL2 TaxID=2486274 RepID=UPI001655C5BF|nr:hypothetical protein [Gordonia sp. OPL2]